MSGSIRGDILVPAINGVTLETLVERCYQAIGPAIRTENDPQTGHIVRVPVSLEDSKLQLLHDIDSPDFFIEDIPLGSLFWSPSDTYHDLTTLVDKAYFEDTGDGDFHLDQMERFAMGWATLCEKLGADYAYFAPMLNVVDDETITTEVLPILQPNKKPEERARYMLYVTRHFHWLTYLSQRLVQDLPQEQLDQYNEKAIKAMSSGALFFTSQKTPY